MTPDCAPTAIDRSSLTPASTAASASSGCRRNPMTLGRGFTATPPAALSTGVGSEVYGCGVMVKQRVSGTVIPATDDSPPAILIEVTVPADLAMNLQLKAGPSKSVGDYLIDLASRFGELPVDDFRAMYLSSKVRDEMERIFGRGIQNPEALLDLLRRSKTLNFKGIGEITVPDDVLELLKARFYGLEEQYDSAAEVRKFIEGAFDRMRVQGV